MRKTIGALACMCAGGCAQAQLNMNTGDLATSMGSLEMRQIVSNLVRAIDDEGYIPSQAILSLGTANTANGITPTFALPFGYGFTAGSALATGGMGGPGTSITGGSTFTAPTLSVQVSDTWNQSWTFTPPTEPGQIGRLRELYLYVSGYTKAYGKTHAEIERIETERERQYLSSSSEAGKEKFEKDFEDEIKTRFLCNYPMQAMAINFSALVQPTPAGSANNTPADRAKAVMTMTKSPDGGGDQKSSNQGSSPVNVVYMLDCPDERIGPLGRKINVMTHRTVYADPTFLTGTDCIVCLDVSDWSKRTFDARVGGIFVEWKFLWINPRLKFRLVHSEDSQDPAMKRTRVGNQWFANLYVDAGDETKLGDLAMFTHQALSMPTSSTSGALASGKTTGGNLSTSFVLPIGAGAVR